MLDALDFHFSKSAVIYLCRQIYCAKLGRWRFSWFRLRTIFVTQGDILKFLIVLVVPIGYPAFQFRSGVPSKKIAACLDHS